jgi:hypothetical protein
MLLLFFTGTGAPPAAETRTASPMALLGVGGC